MGIGNQARGAEAASEVDNVHETELPRRNQEESDHQFFIYVQRF